MRDAERRMAEPTAREKIELPASTGSPMITAFGITLLGAGLLTNAAVSVAGALLTLVGAVGWWRQVLPTARMETFAFSPRRVTPAEPGRPETRRHAVTTDHSHRLRLPLEVPPYSAGIWGGVAGGAAMAAVALGYGVWVQHSPWYPINLLAAAALPGLSAASDVELRGFNGTALALGTLAHGTVSLLVGLLYVLILPMLPRRHMLWGGVVAPLLWTGVVWAVLGIVDPALDARIDWPWFVASQIAFGVVAGIVVARTKPLETPQTRFDPDPFSGSRPPGHRGQ